MAKYLTFYLLLLSLSCPVSAQELETFKVVFWNVENLFDVEKDSLKDDSEFLPTSIRRWHYGRYKEKLANVARTITAIGEWQPPALVGLCEVENANVMNHLTKYASLSELGYRYIVTDSPDHRGIDVALLYQRERFKLIGSQSIRVAVNKPTRDILHATGLLATGDTVDVFVGHFPSRSGGEKETEPLRLEAARTMRSAIDSLFTVRIFPKIIVMGDFNDYPTNKSVATILQAHAPTDSIIDNALYHVLARKATDKNYGSHKYQGRWGLLDHLVVSGALLKQTNAVYTTEEKAGVVRFPFLLTPDTKYGGDQPFRTYYGMKYQGGFSDHLPIMMELVMKVEY